MSALPAASSFSGAEGSEGACGCTSRPTARKSPCEIAEYSAAWSALGKKSSTTVNGFAPDAEIVSCLEPQADRPSSDASAGASSAAGAAGRGRPERSARDGRGGCGRTLNGFLLPVGWPTAPERRSASVSA